MDGLEAVLLDLAGAIGDLVGEFEFELGRLGAVIDRLAAAPGRVGLAVEDELDELGEPVRSSAIAATAHTLARELDGPDATAAEVASCSRALRAAMDRLHELAPGEGGGDGVDEIARQRERRRAGAAGT